jgi:hypothetical protein
MGVEKGAMLRGKWRRINKERRSEGDDNGKRERGWRGEEGSVSYLVRKQ